MTDFNKKRENLKIYINDHCIFRANPNTKYSAAVDIGFIPSNAQSNKKGNTLTFFIRRVLFNNFYLSIATHLLGNKIVDVMCDENSLLIPFQLAAVENAGVPLVIGLQEAFKKIGISINAFSVRKKRKTSGLFNYIEGTPNDLPVIVVDDLVKSGNSIYRTMLVIEDELNLELAPVFATVMALNTEQQLQNFIINTRKQENGIKPLYLFTKNDFDLEYDETKYWIPKDVG